ncbi:hypothetical protein RESH_03796 [Rhodopirellula europaea SH398]|uniref:Uncharacterized protein n=1 Tax=Rhodopirellula europaea SH398 TaxID=1263868 RepID=M5S1T9_9BACT|nr:hypothetical protein RESH_03796 [Rhodopirellula europaea SH398]
MKIARKLDLVSIDRTEINERKLAADVNAAGELLGNTSFHREDAWGSHTAFLPEKKR